jgi:hypothetical protein
MVLGEALTHNQKTPIWGWVLAGICGLILGIASALWLSNAGFGGSQIINGKWSTDPLIGAKAANPWLRARIARVGLLALSKEETLYFDRTTDESGAPLRESCQYRIEGQPIATRWWSMTIYGKDQFLPRNTDKASSIDATRALGDAGEAWTGIIAASRPADTQNWVSSKAAGDFSLTLRLYNPSSVEPTMLTKMAFPTINRVACYDDQQGEDK